ncbi:MAG: hypothetical protein H7257_05850 [Taibaiella sp.]|nr:hypothetical protein [Taibaiella sp.]
MPCTKIVLSALKITCYTIVAVCFITAATAQKSKLVEGVINKEAILSDLDAYARGIADNHVHPFNAIKKKDFFAKIEEIKNTYTQYNIDVMLIKWLQVNALIGDEHTNIGYESIVRDRIPLNCYWFKEGIYITGTMANDLTHLYFRIIAVNNTPITESRNSAIFTIINLKGDTSKITTTPIDKRDARLLRGFDKESFLRMSVRGSYGFKYIDSGHFIYFRYASCKEDTAHPFKDFEAKLISETKRPGRNKIIIDMRDNRGGSPRMLEPFIDYLNTSPLNRKGAIYVLTGRKTFSAAILNSVYLKNQTRAIIAGEETSGSVAHYGFIKQIKLPATRLTFTYSTQYVVTNERYDGSLQPDVLIPETFADYSTGVDAALNYAITH